jgi:hypothetical protein
LSESKEGRVISLSKHGLTWFGSDGLDDDSHPYLFICARGNEPFIEAARAQHELNDFSVVLLQGVREKSASAVDMTEEEWEELDIEEQADLLEKRRAAYELKHLGDLYCPASILVMLYAILIRSMHEIARYYDKTQYTLWQGSRSGRGSELERLIQLLERISGQELTVFSERRVRILLDKTVRPLRNDFLHGDWDGVETRLVGVSLRNCFEVVSLVLRYLEEVFDESTAPWLQDRFIDLA